METWEIIVKCAENAYKSVYGREKWDSLTDQQKHDAVMCIVVGFNTIFSAVSDELCKED